MNRTQNNEYSHFNNENESDQNMRGMIEYTQDHIYMNDESENSQIQRNM